MKDVKITIRAYPYYDDISLKEKIESALYPWCDIIDYKIEDVEDES